ncbi:MAG: glutamyl-tRNA(Gln) amidotransferase, C subunit [SAR86 cluster bacterium SAR86A]|jgi:aspartyl-tRNA(Asn)/glutamyl-tRNA(Gln) amidotransferase subunit C|uniref:Aspartyl/glutamyl-tRNA(Asn/Gln) amidotransferase subunit C n=1 Tax=SAR86 cluster bacterium SAR86A TaxID=1123866 RepID=J4UZ11_9GAMM|nr:MAG: glutamyl-tRNA(Gln) amidotransferase, C subunit [SAR86 cluster bacterium SAR86A]MAN84914.1 Asp-tRNA(Asn)/Glu-tRNA(Gln) amidotransferase GatCAB subunit C [Gammaproteobacteria bacterium]|tara:strand:- start:194 stop:475 length:282 start_codon:yes stop_codon:yes gene_type:complete
MDKKTVTTISYLSRLKIDDEKEEKIIEDLDNIIKFVDQLNIIDTSDVAPLTNPLEKTAKTRKDIVTAKNLKKDLLEVAPSSNDDYFLVPRVVE